MAHDETRHIGPTSGFTHENAHYELADVEATAYMARPPARPPARSVTMRLQCGIR